MVYLVEIATNIHNISAFEIISKGFSCTSNELLREIATHGRCKPVDIKGIEFYQDVETAKEIANARK